MSHAAPCIAGRELQAHKVGSVLEVLQVCQDQCHVEERRITPPPAL